MIPFRKFCRHGVRFTSRVPFLLIVFSGLFSQAFCQKDRSVVFAGNTIRVDDLNTKIEHIMAGAGVPGISLAVIDNGNVVFSNVYGYKTAGGERNEKINKETIFEICSVSKTLLAYVVHKMVSQGKFNLDKPMYQYLEHKRLDHDSRYKLITPRMILSHTSGLENYADDYNPNILEIVSIPGEKQGYSGEGYNYLARIISTILNQTYEEYIEENVLRPFRLDRTFTRFEQRGVPGFKKTYPRNYAIGHDILMAGGEKAKWIESIPAGSVHTTAGDYAKFLLMAFNDPKLALPKKNITDILSPSTALSASDSLYYGLGFEVSKDANDTILIHSGDNSGFKTFVCYSLVNKSGLVLLTNSDTGYNIAKAMSALTTELELKNYFKHSSPPQYPSEALALLKTYRVKKSENMLATISDLERKGKLDFRTLDTLSRLFFNAGVDYDMAEKLLKKSISLNPQSPLAYTILGSLYMERDDYEHAYPYLKDARARNFDQWNIEEDISKCEEDLFKKRESCSNANLIEKTNVSKIQAENYCRMRGVFTRSDNDEVVVNYIDPGDWMEYDIDVAFSGSYSLTFNVACLINSGVKITSNNRVLSEVVIPSTQAWSTWKPVEAHLQLEKGRQTIRIVSSGDGNFDLNWLEFSYGVHK